MESRKTYGVSTLIHTLRFYGSYPLSNGRGSVPVLKKMLEDIDYVRNQIIKKLEELEHGETS